VSGKEGAGPDGVPERKKRMSAQKRSEGEGGGKTEWQTTARVDPEPVYLYSTPSRGTIAEFSENGKLEYPGLPVNKTLGDENWGRQPEEGGCLT
jgi:hypothetical protein